MKIEIIESKTYRKQTYNICFDGREYFLMAINSIGIPEVMTYHPTLEDASDSSAILSECSNPIGSRSFSLIFRTNF